MDQLKLDARWLETRVNADYRHYCTFQMRTIIDKITVELKRRYGDRLDLIKDPVLMDLMKGL